MHISVMDVAFGVFFGMLGYYMVDGLWSSFFPRKHDGWIENRDGSWRADD